MTDSRIVPEAVLFGAVVKYGLWVANKYGMDRLRTFKANRSACGCMGPQDGEPLCPCDMRTALEKHLPAVLKAIDPPSPEDFVPQTNDRLWGEATSKVDWQEGSHYHNWRDYIGPLVRGIWHTLTNDQKFALASDALARACLAEDA